MSAYLLLVVCLGLGVAFARWAPMPAQTPDVVSAWILRVALPALVLVQVPKLHFDAALWAPALAPWGLMAGAAILFPWLGRRYGWDRPTVGCLILTCGLSNTSFIGLPMIAALRGTEALGPALIADQFGTFAVLSTAGFGFVTWYSGRSASAAEFASRILMFPPVWAMVIGLAVGQIGAWPAPLEGVLQRLGETLTPLALFGVGLQLKLGSLKQDWALLLSGLGWKLVAGPLLVWFAVLAVGLDGLAADVAVLQMAMPPMITGGILAQHYGLAPRLASALIGVGAILSFATVPLWSLLIA